MPAPLAEKLIEARQAVREQLAAKGLKHLVESFDPSRYNVNATICENLLFGVPVGNMFNGGQLAGDSYLRTVLEKEALIEPLTEMGLRIAEITAEMFAGLPPAHPLFERYSFIRSNEMEDFQRLIDVARQRGGRARLPDEGRARLITLALGYIEPRHRLSLLDASLNAHIVRARASFMRHLPQAYADRIEFYDPARIMTAAPLRDNILFGRIAFEGSNAEQRVWEVVRSTVAALGLKPMIYRLGLDSEVGPGGRLLHGPQRAAINLARSLIKRPEILVIDGGLSAYGAAEGRIILEQVTAAMRGKTLIVALSDPAEAQGFDVVLHFEGPRVVDEKAIAAAVA